MKFKISFPRTIEKANVSRLGDAAASKRPKGKQKGVAQTCAACPHMDKGRGLPAAGRAFLPVWFAYDRVGPHRGLLSYLPHISRIRIGQG